jgi:hypothetical protein
MSRARGYAHVCKRACVRGIAGIAELELALNASLGMSEQYRLRWQDAVEKLDAPKGNELTSPPRPASFGNQEASGCLAANCLIR